MFRCVAWSPSNWLSWSNIRLLQGQADRIKYLQTKQAKIVAMTCTHAALKRREFLDIGFKYDNLLMEESAQILEIESFIPMLLQVSHILNHAIWEAWYWLSFALSFYTSWISGLLSLYCFRGTQDCTQHWMFRYPKDQTMDGCAVLLRSPLESSRMHQAWSNTINCPVQVNLSTWNQLLRLTEACWGLLKSCCMCRDRRME